MNWRDRITVDPKVLMGKPVIKGTRIAVVFLMELLAEGWTHEQVLKNYPNLTSDDIQAALHVRGYPRRSAAIAASRCRKATCVVWMQD